MTHHDWRPQAHSNLEAFRLLADLHNMLASKFPFPPLVVLLLIGELCLVLQAGQLSPRLLDGVELAELQLLHGLVVPEKHGMFRVLLGLTLVYLLKYNKTVRLSQKKRKRSFLVCY